MISSDIFIQQIIILFLGIVEILIGLFVLLNNPKSIINRSFFFFILGIAGWIIGVSLLHLTSLFIFDKLVFISVFFMITGLVVFTKVFPNVYKIEKRFYWVFLPWIFLYFGLPFNFFIKEISLDAKGIVRADLGPLFAPFLILFAFYVIFSIFLIISKYRKSAGIAKVQLHYLFLAIGLFAVTAFIFDIFLPAIGIYQLNLLGPIATLIFIILIAYAIMVHHLMDIWVVIRLGAVFSLVFALISLMYVGFVNFLVTYLGTSDFFSLVIVSFVITLTFEPLKRFVENVTDRIFFRKHYKVDEVIGELTSVVHNLELNLNKILVSFNEIIIRYFKVNDSVIAILNPKGFYVSKFTVGKVNYFELSPDNPIIVFLKSNPDFIINKEDLNLKMKSGNLELSVENIELIPDIIQQLDQFSVSVALPIEARGQMIGIYFLGEKGSKDPFTEQDIKLLDHLTSEIGAFIDNARLYEDLKKLDEAKSSFLSVVSHQLRTPLSAIRWSTELLLEESLNKENRREFLKDNYKNSIFMIYHLDDMLTALDIEDKKVQLKLETCRFRNIIDDVLADNNRIIESKKLKVEIDLDSISERLLCDCKKLKKVMEVMFFNAINYAPENGKIVISAKEKSDHPKILEVSVEDNGIGITEEEQKHIFEKFFRSEEAKKNSPNGFGLGLFIVKSFVEAHGGEIHFESLGRNKGVKFSFTIPVKNMNEK